MAFKSAVVCNVVDVANHLLQGLVGLNQIGLVYLNKNHEIQAEEFFASLETASDRISILMFNPEVKYFWVGAQTTAEGALTELLQEIYRGKTFDADSNMNKNGVVYDISW